MKIDETDKKILEILQEGSDITNSQLASEIGISPPGMLDRVKRLQNSGIIKKYVALVDNDKIGKGTIAYVSVTLNAHDSEIVELFKEKINQWNEVLECYHIAGEEDFILKIILEDIKAYERFVVDKLNHLPKINKIKTTFVLSTVKHSTKIEVVPGTFDGE